MQYFFRTTNVTGPRIAFLLLVFFNAATSFSKEYCPTTLQGILRILPFSKMNPSNIFSRSFRGPGAPADPRFLRLNLAKLSPSFDVIDDLISPATQSHIFKPKTKNLGEFMWASERNGAVYEIISKNSNDQQTLVLVSEIERSFRNSMMVLNSAYKAKTGKDVLDSRQYYLELQTLIVKVFSDLKANGKFFDELSGNIDFDVNAVLSQTPDIFQNLIAPELFQNEFLENFVANVEFGKLSEAVSTYLSKQIEFMPVGISLRPMDFTSTLRFGDFVFKGNYGSFVTIPTGAYERGPQTNLGVFHSILNLSKAQKKAIAVVVDRTHQTLDVLNGLQSPCDRKMHFCGSYAPVTFLKEGIWPRSFGIALPSTPILSAWILNMLKLTGPGSLQVIPPTGRNLVKRWYVVPFAIAHDFGGPVFDVYVVGSVAVFGGTTLLKLLNINTGEEAEILIDGSPSPNSPDVPPK